MLTAAGEGLYWRGSITLRSYWLNMSKRPTPWW
jgi:hypothetical protein